MEVQVLEFPLPHKPQDKQEAALSEVKRVCPKGWEPDRQFTSQDSIFTKNGVWWARCPMRRWVKKKDKKKYTTVRLEE